MTTVEKPITRSELRDELRHYATSSDLAQLRADMSAMETRLVKWMIGVMFGGAALAASLALAMERIVG